MQSQKRKKDNSDRNLWIIVVHALFRTARLLHLLKTRWLDHLWQSVLCCPYCHVSKLYVLCVASNSCTGVIYCIYLFSTLKN